MNKSKKNKNFWPGIICDVLTAVLLTAIGLLGPMAFNQVSEKTISGAPVFWTFSGLVIVFIALFSFRLKAQAVKTQEAQQELIDQSHHLEEVIRTLPPEGFLNLFAEKYEEAHTVYKSLLNSGRPLAIQDIELAVRGLLLGILRLTAYYDRAQDDDVYGANIMIFTDAYKSDSTLKAELLGNLRFANDDLDPDQLKGLLYLKHELSTSSEDQNGIPDNNITGILITLPVPQAARSSVTNKFKALPGAPLAVVDNSANIYSNSETLREWLDEQGDFNETITQQIHEYFTIGVGREIKSFCSIPLANAGGEPFAVLNVHKLRAGLLAQTGQFELYLKVMSPFLALLSELVAERCKL